MLMRITIRAIQSQKINSQQCSYISTIFLLEISQRAALQKPCSCISRKHLISYFQTIPIIFCLTLYLSLNCIISNMSDYIQISQFHLKHKCHYFSLAASYLLLLLAKLALLSIIYSRDSRIFDLVGIIFSIVHFFTFILTVNSMKNHFTTATIAVHSLCSALDVSGLICHVLDKLNGPDELLKLLGFCAFKAVPLGIHVILFLSHCCGKRAKNDQFRKLQE